MIIYLISLNITSNLLGMVSVSLVPLRPIRLPTLLVFCTQLELKVKLIPVCFNLCKVNDFVKWFHRYLTNRQGPVTISGTLSSSYTMKPRVPHGSTLGPLRFNTFINDIYGSIHNSNCLVC
jgi:hypothetical protein